MSELKVFLLARKFLTTRMIEFVDAPKLGQIVGDRLEVIFPVPEALDPNVAVVDPPDVRVWVDRGSGEVEIIEQM